MWNTLDQRLEPLELALLEPPPELEPELTLRLPLELEPLENELPELTLRLPELDTLLELRVLELELLELTLRLLELELLELTLRVLELEFEVPVLTLRLFEVLVLLGRVYVWVDCVERLAPAETLLFWVPATALRLLEFDVEELTLRLLELVVPELTLRVPDCAVPVERLPVAGATVRT